MHSYEVDLTDTGENVQKWTRVFWTRRWVKLVARTHRKKEKKIACPLLNVFACGEVSSPRLYRLSWKIKLKSLNLNGTSGFRRVLPVSKFHFKFNLSSNHLRNFKVVNLNGTSGLKKVVPVTQFSEQSSEIKTNRPNNKWPGKNLEKIFSYFLPVCLVFHFFGPFPKWLIQKSTKVSCLRILYQDTVIIREKRGQIIKEVFGAKERRIAFILSFWEKLKNNVQMWPNL